MRQDGGQLAWEGSLGELISSLCDCPLAALLGWRAPPTPPYAKRTDPTGGVGARGEEELEMGEGEELLWVITAGQDQAEGRGGSPLGVGVGWQGSNLPHFHLEPVPQGGI